MTTTTFYAVSAPVADQATVRSRNATYATARTGGTLAVLNSTSQSIGQQFNSPNYDCHEGFVEFDTSSIPDNASISSATLSFIAAINASGSSFTVEARVYDYGGGQVATGDYLSGASLGSQTLVASLASGSWSGGNRNSLTSTASMLGAVNKTGYTRFILCTDRHTNGNTPTGQERLTTVALDAGTDSNKAQLVVIYEVFEQTGAGGMALGGVATCTMQAIGPTSGGVVIGGVATCLPNFKQSPTGGLLIGGAITYGYVTVSIGAYSVNIPGDIWLTQDEEAITTYIESLPNVGAGNVSVSFAGGNFILEFIGDLAGFGMPTAELDRENLITASDAIDSETTQNASRRCPECDCDLNAICGKCEFGTVPDSLTVVIADLIDLEAPLNGTYVVDTLDEAETCADGDCEWGVPIDIGDYIWLKVRFATDGYFYVNFQVHVCALDGTKQFLTGFGFDIDCETELDNLDVPASIIDSPEGTCTIFVN